MREVGSLLLPALGRSFEAAVVIGLYLLGFDYLGVTGKFAATVAKVAEQSGMRKSRIKICKDKEVMAEWIASLVARKKIGRNDWLLIKGSRGMRMEQVQHSLVKRLTLDKN